MRTISLYLRFRGVQLINFLDDFLFLVSDSQSTAHRKLVLDTFKLAGLAINESKSHLQFTRRLLTHLGFVIGLDFSSFKVPLERWESLQQLITVALSRQKVLVHLLSRISSHLSSMISGNWPYCSHQIKAMPLLPAAVQLAVLRFYL